MGVDKTVSTLFFDSVKFIDLEAKVANQLYIE